MSTDTETAPATSDGISRCDWDQVRFLATEIANAAIAEDAQRENCARSRMLVVLEEMQSKYGDRPSILATRADYVDVLPEKIALLEKAFGLARQAADADNMLFIAHSLAQLWVDECRNADKGRLWLSALASCLAVSNEPYEREEYERLQAELVRQGQSSC